VGRKLASVKSFVRWLADEGLFPEGIEQKICGHSGVAGPKLPFKIPPIPSEQEVTLLLNGEFPTAFPERDRLLLELLYDDGLRVAEASGLKVQDIRAEQGALLVHGKGNKTRLVPIGTYVRKALDVYLPLRAARLERRTRAQQLRSQGHYQRRIAAELGVNQSTVSGWLRGHGDRETDALFLGLAGQSAGGAIDVRNVRRMLKAICAARGLKPMHPHTLRHACASHMLDRGAPLVVIAQLLGHARLSTTSAYAHVSHRKLLDAYRKAHPHAKGAQA
jgi:integrase/recombinase XerC